MDGFRLGNNWAGIDSILPNEKIPAVHFPGI